MRCQQVGSRLKRGGKEIAKNIRQSSRPIIASDSETCEIIVSPWFHFERSERRQGRLVQAGESVATRLRRRKSPIEVLIGLESIFVGGEPDQSWLPAIKRGPKAASIA